MTVLGWIAYLIFSLLGFELQKGINILTLKAIVIEPSTYYHSSKLVRAHKPHIYVVGQ